MFDLRTTSDILSLKKPHIYECSCFRLFLKSKSKRCCMEMASVPGILSKEYTIGVKVCLRSIQSWWYLSLFSFSVMAGAYTEI